MKKIIGFIFAIALIISIFAGCSPSKKTSPMERPPLVERVIEEEFSIAELKSDDEEFITEKSINTEFINGDFESSLDDFGELSGWDVQFSEWGEGDESASWGLSSEVDNIPNTTQKLSVYNGMTDDVEFTITQTVIMPAGNYTSSLIFEGGPQGNLDVNLSINGKEQPFEQLRGWKNWKQVVVEDVIISGNEEITIEVKGILKPTVWLAIDDIALVLEEEFTKKFFSR